jgi:hypothetical protein
VLICINDRRDHPAAGWRRQAMATAGFDNGRRRSDATTETQVSKSGLGALNGHGALAIGTIGAAIAAAAVAAVVLAFVLAFAGMIAPAAAASPPAPAPAPAGAALSAASQQCLICHGSPGFQTKLADGATLSLTIEADHFAPSVHGALGCTGCHADISLPSHPAAVQPIASLRAFSIAMSQQVCGTCHADQFKLWGQSVHAALVKENNPLAPVCTSCHSPHTMSKGEASALATVPCKTCHSTIYAAYAVSVHGVLRNGGLATAPLCFNCHGAHDVAVPSAGVGRRDVCLGCHTEAAMSHATWLPNVELHFGVVSCPVCHTPNAQRVVDLILYNSTTQQEISGPPGIPEFENMGGAPAAMPPGLDPMTLMTLLTTLNSQGVKAKTSIRGRLEVRTGVEDHQLTFAAKAISNCDTCHRKGAAAFQSVEISVAGPAGIPIHYGANQNVLSSALSLDSVGGFYAIGGSRITFLDVLFVLALFVAIGGCGVHMIARWAIGRYFPPSPDEQHKG